MGTFGTGPFSSDGALDFLEGLAERPPEQHLDVLRHTFTYVLADRGLLWREFFPDEVVAAAALVAAALPGGEHLQRRLTELSDETDMPVLPTSASGLAASALEALRFVAGPDGPWHQGWTTEADKLDAQRTIDDLVATFGRRSGRTWHPRPETDLSRRPGTRRWPTVGPRGRPSRTRVASSALFLTRCARIGRSPSGMAARVLRGR